MSQCIAATKTILFIKTQSDEFDTHLQRCMFLKLNCGYKTYRFLLLLTEPSAAYVENDKWVTAVVKVLLLLSDFAMTHLEGTDTD